MILKRIFDDMLDWSSGSVERQSIAVWVTFETVAAIVYFFILPFPNMNGDFTQKDNFLVVLSSQVLWSFVILILYIVHKLEQRY